jgi:hypothetical protein
MLGCPMPPSVGGVGFSFQPAHEYVSDDFTFRPNFPVTPEHVELDEIRRTQGDDASLARSARMLRNERRRQFRTDRRRYADIAAQINLHRAAERIVEQKLAAQRAATAHSDASRPSPKAASASAAKQKKAPTGNPNDRLSPCGRHG